MKLWKIIEMNTMVTKIFLFFLVLVSLFVSCGKSPASANIENNTALPHWKTYTNDSLGITFQYPPSWKKFGKEASISDRFGTIIMNEINFMDSISHATLVVKYHFAPTGALFFQTLENQFDPSKGDIYTEVATIKAIESHSQISIDGKGNPLQMPLQITLVTFLDISKTGSLELQFKSPLNESNTENIDLKQLLSTFHFIKQ